MEKGEKGDFPAKLTPTAGRMLQARDKKRIRRKRGTFTKKKWRISSKGGGEG